MTDLPRRAITRGARLAALPLGYAGRTALGVGKRVGGASAEAVALEVQQRTAEQVFKTLGELKGGAMKFGQAMSIAEVALPEELLGPYRATLTKLQDAAPPMPADTVHRQLVEALGDNWRDRFESFDDKPTAAASIGQVHKAVWRDGREVAVKIQYPGAGKALMSDLNQVARMARMFASMSPGMDIKPLIAELKDRAAEELDYLHESQSQRQFAAAYEDDEDFVVPHVLAAAPTVVVSEWLDGYSLAKVISDGTQEERDHYGTLYLRFLMSGPTRAKMLHADPHPGNYRVLGDGRLGVLDFGAVSKMPDGPPEAMGSLLRLAMLGDSEATVAGLRAEGFLKPDIDGRHRAVPQRPPAVRRAGAARGVPLLARLDARALQPAQRPAQPRLLHRLQDQPAADVHAHAPHLAGRDRRAQPDGRDRAHARRARALAPQLRQLTGSTSP